MNIYGLYAKNAHRAGFWVQHRTWSNICALIERIDGQESGALDPCAALGSPSRVQALAFDVRSGRPLSFSTFAFDPGDRGFVSIAEPAWSHPALSTWRPTTSRPIPLVPR